MADGLLPPNATDAERALDQATARIGAVPVPVGDLWDPWACPVDLLPWLAWALSVDEWDPDWPEATKRTAIARSLELHRYKGTVWAVREALKAAGYSDASIEEGLPPATYNGAESYAGTEDYGGGARWALFRVVTDLGEDKSLTGADIRRITRMIARYKPARSHLRDLGYQVTVADEVAPEDQVATTVHPEYEDIRPAGRRYDASITYDQAVPLRYDGAYRYRAGVDYDGRDERGETYSTVWDRLPIDLDMDLEADEVAVNARYDGRLRYSGFSYGADAPAVVDPAMPVQVQRHIRYDGRHSHAGATYDGTWRFDGAHDYWGGIHYAGDQIIEEAVL